MSTGEPTEELDGRTPQRFGPYVIEGRIGAGGTGVVYRARHTESGEVVAVKTVRVRSLAHIGSVRREILALHRLRHPGIVRILDGGVERGRPWYAMELLTGCTLRDALGGTRDDSSTIQHLPRIQRRVPENLSLVEHVKAPAAGGRLIDVLTTFRLLCAPLAYLHGEGTVHRDIKPSNIFVRPDGTPVLMDFGLVGRWRGFVGRDLQDDAQPPGGTIVYMSPEQARGERGDARSDLYSLGCTLYEALTGALPFEQGTSPEAQLLLPSELVTGVPPALDMLVARLLEKDPRERIGHADEVARALEALGARDWPKQGLPRARSYLYQPRLVGRDPSVEALLEGVTSSRKVGGLLIVGGESGVGKTALVSEVARRAYERGHVVVTSECRSPSGGPGHLERTPPLVPFRPLLRHIVEHCRVSGPEATERIAGRFRRLLATIEPSFADLGPSLEEPPDLPVQAALERMLAALSDTIAAFAKESAPLLLVIDDIQWADGLSLGLLSRLGADDGAENLGRVVVLTNYRKEDEGPWLESLLELPRTLHVELGRLGPDDVSRMVGDMLGAPNPPERLCHVVAEASDGNPFLVGEYLRAALDSGLLFRDAAGRWSSDERTTGPWSLALPHSAKALLERRLHSLSDEARALTGLSAVIGREIGVDMLLSIAQRHLLDRRLSERDWAELLSELRARHVLVEKDRSTLAFSHETLRRAAYDGIKPERRVRLHGHVASELEAQRGHDVVGELAAELAHHYEQSKNFRRAVDFLEQSGDLALSRSAHADAAAAYRRALRLAREQGVEVSDQRRARWQASAGAALQGLGRLSESKHHLNRAVSLLGWSTASFPIGVGAQIARESVRQLFHRLLGRGTKKAPRPGPLLSAARAYDHLVQVHYFEADRLALVHAMLMTLNLAERAGPSPELASAYANTFAALSLAPPLRRVAESYLSRAEQALGDHPDPAVESYLALVRGVQLAGMGRWDEGEPCVRKAVDIADRLGFRRRWEEGMAILAYNHSLRGAHESALAEARAVERSAVRGDPQTRCWSLVVHAQTKLALGNPEDACDALSAAEELALRLGRDEQVWVGGIRAAAELERGAVDRAEKAAEVTLTAIGANLPMVSASGEAYAAVADVFVELYRQDRSKAGHRLRQAERACRALERVARAFPFMEPRALLCRGDIARLLGRERRARVAFRRSIEAARRCQLERVAARAEARLATG